MKKIWLPCTIAASLLTSIAAHSASAAIVTYDFRVDLTEGTLYQNYFENPELDPNCPGAFSFYCPIPANETTLGPLFGEVGVGSFTFDDTAEPNGFGAIPLTSLSFNFDEASFTLADNEISTPGFVNSRFQFGIDRFSVRGEGPPPGELVTRSLRDFGIEGNRFFYDFADTAGTPDFLCIGCVTYTLRSDTSPSIPEPSSILSLLTLSFLGIGSRVYRTYSRK